MIKKFTIKKGNHYSTPPHIRFHFGITKLKFKFRFSKDCLYPINNTDDLDINKLYGFSHAWHHKNSLRLGWIPSPTQTGRIELYKYCYNYGKRIPDYLPIAVVDAESWYEASISIDEVFGLVTFIISDPERNLTLAISSSMYRCPQFKWGYMLKPYFGGDHVAPHDMSISIQQIEQT